MSSGINAHERLQVVHKYHLKNLLIEPLGRTISSPQKNTNLWDRSGSTTLNYTNASSLFSAPKKKPSFSPEPQITNFFDKTQINGVITSQNNFSKRIGALDFIIQRQKEIKEAEDHYRMEKSAPIIRKWAENFHKRRTNKVNSKGNSFLKLVNDVLARKTSDFQTEGSVSGRTRCQTLPPNNILMTENEDPSFFKRPGYVSQDDLDISRDLKEEKEKPPQRSQAQKLSHLSFLLSRKGRRDSTQPLDLNIPPSDRKPKSPETQGIPVKRKTFSEAYKFGEKNLENDILNYLVTYPGEESECNAFLKASVTKEKTFKKIETKARRQFISLRNEDSGPAYFLPRPPVKKNSTKKLQEIVGSPKHQSYMVKKDGFLPKANEKEVKRSTKTFCLLRKTIDLDAEKSNFDHGAESPEFRNGNLGESFISITETKLDNLYRENRKLQSSIRNLDSHLKVENERNKVKKIQQSIRAREGNWDNNSHEIIRTFLKKTSKSPF